MSYGKSRSHGWNGDKLTAIKQRVAAVRELLKCEGEWCVYPIDFDRRKLDSALTILRNAGAVQVVDRRYPYDENEHGWEMDGGSYRNMYRWTPEAKADIQEYVDGLTTFPDCEHRVHIHNPRDTPEGVFACKECGETYDRATVEALL